MLSPGTQSRSWSLHPRQVGSQSWWWLSLLSCHKQTLVVDSVDSQDNDNRVSHRGWNLEILPCDRSEPAQRLESRDWKVEIPPLESSGLTQSLGGRRYRQPELVVLESPVVTARHMGLWIRWIPYISQSHRHFWLKLLESLSTHQVAYSLSLTEVWRSKILFYSSGLTQSLGGRRCRQPRLVGHWICRQGTSRHTDRAKELRRPSPRHLITQTAQRTKNGDSSRLRDFFHLVAVFILSLVSSRSLNKKNVLKNNTNMRKLLVKMNWKW